MGECKHGCRGKREMRLEVGVGVDVGVGVGVGLRVGAEAGMWADLGLRLGMLVEWRPGVGRHESVQCVDCALVSVGIGDGGLRLAVGLGLAVGKDWRWG